MREIKFRGKRLDNGEWEHGDLVQFGQQCYTPCKCAIIPGTASGSDPLCKILFDYEVAPATVGQYTGLKDKNGNEICEGDILLDESGTYAVVGYSMGAFYVDFGEGFDLRHFTECIHEICEVVGNIHDDPKLLKTE
ncbi:MAG: YopX family protein [Alistipes shahii]